MSLSLKQKNILAAVRSGDAKGLAALLEKNTKTSVCAWIDCNEEIFLHVAAAEGHLECMTVLLKNGADINARDRYGRTPFIHAVSRGRHDCLVALIDVGADIKNTDFSGDTALHHAARSGSAACIETLLKGGFDPQKQNSVGQTALHMAARCPRNRFMETVRLLLEANATIDARDHGGLTPLALAAMHRYDELISFFAENGASVDSVDNEGISPLMLAASCGNLSVCETLVSLKADVGIATKSGRTALHFAAEGRKCFRENHLPEICEVLVASGCDVNAKTSTGLTPAMLAGKSGFMKVIEVLVENGADLSIKDKKHRRAEDRVWDDGDKLVVSATREVGELEKIALTPRTPARRGRGL